VGGSSQARCAVWSTVLAAIFITSSPASASPLSDSDVVQGAIVLAGDEARYTFGAIPGQNVFVRVVDQLDGDFIPTVEILDPSGVRVASGFNRSVAAAGIVTRSAGVYTIVVSDYHATNTGPFALFFARAPGANEGGALGDSDVRTGEITLGDLDSYTFTATGGENVSLRVADESGGDFIPRVDVFDPTGTRVSGSFGQLVAGSSIVARTAGTYTVIVSDYRATSAGAYSLYFVRTLGANEGGELGDDDLVLGEIDLGDLDSYTFHSSPGKNIRMRVTDDDGSSFIPTIGIFDPDGVRVSSAFGQITAAVGLVTAKEGIYTAVISDYRGTGTGAYTLRFKSVPGANEGGELPNDAVVSDSIDLGDLDAYTFVAEPGENIRLRVADETANGFIPTIEVFDPDGTRVASAFGQDVAASNLVAAKSGIYTVIVSDYRATGEGEYTLRFVRLPGADERGLLEDSDVESDEIELGDLDSYTFVAEPGENIRLRVTDDDGGSFIPTIEVFDPDGTRVASAFGDAVAASAVVAAKSGTYTALISDYRATGVGAYTLYFVHVPGANEGGALAASDVVSEQIDLGDLDTYTFQAAPGENIRLRVSDESGNDFVPTIEIFDPDGTRVASAFGAVVAASSLVAAKSGTYTVLVSDYHATAAGEYRMHFARMPGANDGGHLGIGGLALGSIELGDLDAFTTGVLAGQRIEVVVTENVDAGGFTPVIEVFSPTGVRVASAFGATGATLRFTAAATGTYTVLVSDYRATGTGSYSLRTALVPTP